jgi:hypothetical protein
MIQPLRAWHRRAIFLLAPLLPAIFAAGIASRHGTVPANPALKPDASLREWRAPVSLKAGEATASVARSADGGWLRIELSNHPDVLVYWTATPLTGAALPSHARLLGTAAGPVRLLSRTGAIMLYSLPHQQLIGGIRLEDLP